VAADFLEKMKMTGRHYSSMRERKGRGATVLLGHATWAGAAKADGKRGRKWRGRGGLRLLGCEQAGPLRGRREGRRRGKHGLGRGCGPGTGPHGEEGEERGWAEPGLQWGGGRK